MPKKKQRTDLPKPDYETLGVEECEMEAEKTKTLIAQKNKLRLETKEQKKAAMGGFNDTLKILEEELEHYDGVLSGLGDRLRRIHAASSIPVVQPTATLPPGIFPFPQPPKH